MARFGVYGVIALGLSVAFGQLGGPQYPPGTYPGRYPRSRGPGIPMPRRGKKDQSKTQAQQEQLKELRGMLRKLDEKELVIEATDKRILHVNVAAGTKYLKDAAEVQSSDLLLGDHLLVEASQDDHGRYYAVRVTREKAGTPAERVAARAPLDEQPRMSEEEPKAAEDERPVLRRAPDSAKKESTPRAGDSEPPAEAPAREVRTAPVRDPDDEGPPRLARGKPAPRRPSPPPEETAELRPVPARAAEPAPPRPIPETAPESDPFIEKARETAMSFVETLPNYVVKQITTRYVSVSKANWQAQDNITTDLVYENGRESYRNIMLNGKPAKGKVEETGAWSTGEFGTILKDLFSGATDADFRQRGSSTIANRGAKVYDFSVEQPNSHWQVITPGQTYRPAYKGKVWIDRETARVLRIEMQSRNMPSEFPLDKVESATDYEFVRIGEGSFLLPTHSETLSCVRGSSQCSRNVIEFRNYRKFASESNITFTPKP
ncbi:MAG: hypothetical protein HY013_04570 [Candidatus Solibacter usitatus]|nr:hypothetical protein [Candidatus Solibacter usitatus]